MQPTWSCPKCNRSFTRKNQRHACGTGNRSDVLRNRPEELVRLYGSLESFVKSFGSIEIVARNGYVLFRSIRIFADLVIMTDAVRVAIHLGRQVEDPIFFKIASNERAVTHVARLQTEKELGQIKEYLKEAYEYSLTQPKKRA